MKGYILTIDGAYHSFHATELEAMTKALDLDVTKLDSIDNGLEGFTPDGKRIHIQLGTKPADPKPEPKPQQKPITPKPIPKTPRPKRTQHTKQRGDILTDEEKEELQGVANGCVLIHLLFVLFALLICIAAMVNAYA